MNKIINNLKTKLSSLFQNIKRKKYLQGLIGKHGQIIEKDDKIIVNVNPKKIKKTKYFNVINLYRTNNFEVEKELKNAFEIIKLNKPIFFIFNGIIFDKDVYLSSMSFHIIFKNCTFKECLHLNSSISVTLENNKYQNQTTEYSCGQAGLIDELTIINDNFANNSKTKVDIRANKVNIINSNICAESKGQINIETKEMNLTDSTITGSEVYLNADSITSSNSIIKSNNGVMIDNENNDFNGNVQAPLFVYNGINLSNHNEVISIDEEKIELQKMRQVLLQRLRNLRDYCKYINNMEVKEIENKLNKQRISQIVKKKTI